MSKNFPVPSGDDDVAVVGLSCRFPGANSPEEYWNLLTAGQEAVAEVPADRAGHVGPLAGRAGLIDGVGDFDAGFFGLSPREAAAMDPRQRLVLELAWEALERAGIEPSAVRGDRVGVFVGAMGDDYATLVHDQGAAAVDSFTLSALQRGILANRISFFLGLTGPSVVVDSAQSSALVAVHQAYESVRRGESVWALAGGVNLILTPESTATAREFGALSPDGRCYTFDARANGYVRGEGAGLAVLMRLADARAHGHDVLCVIRGGAVNNDGGGEQLTRPSRPGQEQVLRLALSDAGLDAGAVGYVELHGTGTPVGDRVESAALGAVFADRDRPLLVGSAKTNLGHLEGAAGAAGFIKAALAVQRGQVPASVHFTAPPADVPLTELGIEVATELRAWPGDGPRVAGVSSFGMGGTNCHLLLAQAPDPRPAGRSRPEHTGTIPWQVSGGTAAALRAQADRLAGQVAAGDHPDVLDIGFSLATTRATFAHRAVVIGTDAAELLVGLTALAADRPASNVVSGAAAEGGTAFMFTGQGAQRTGMGRELYAEFPVFAEALDAVLTELDPLLGGGLREIMWSDAELLGQTRYTQASLFALETALFRLIESCGVLPDHLIGHSIGEVTAAHVAGVLSLPDACALVAARGRLMQSAPSGGAMVAINAAEGDVRALLPDSGVSIAAVNGPGSVVISGDTDEVLALAESFRAKGVKAKRLNVSHAFHSHHLDPVLAEFTDAIAALEFHAPRIPIVSNLTGHLAGPGELTDPGYWSRHIRGAVRFADGIRTLRDAGVSRYLELGPDPVLAGMARETLADSTSAALSTLRTGQAEARTLLRALGTMHVTGAVVDWTPLLNGGRRTTLPTYAFQRRRHWTGETRAAGHTAKPAPPSHDRAGVLDVVRGHLAAVLGHDAADTTASFKDLGLTSLTAVELTDGLSGALGLVLSGSLVFDHPTPDRLATYLHAELTGRGAGVSIQTPAERITDEPVAIVGMGCRYPGGVRSSGDLWDLTLSGRDAISDLPRDRGWELGNLFDADPSASGRTYARHGYFLDDVAGFDAGFFGISPREALAMDPQQRLLLETVWESLEDAGIEPGSLRGSDTGVFVGAMAGDYGPRLDAPHGGVDGYLLTGSSGSVLSGRVAYFLGLEGAAVTVDTACSSSLVALHQAVHAVRGGECGLALAGGVTVMSSPGILVEFSRQRGLSPDGRCKAFGASADGTGWGEGAGVVVLERLSVARARGHRVLAVVRGSAVNQDGASNGLTAPNGPSQQRVIGQALASAGLSGVEVDAVEGHGTGTRLGDPIEAQALLASYGCGRGRGWPLWLGSVKSNIGHTMAAAGVGGVIKMVEALRRGVLPATLHVDEPTPHVDWSGGGVRLLTEAREWPVTGRPRRAGVSSFGISGTNAHVILEQAPPAEEPQSPSVDDGPVGWALSARSEEALRAYARRIAAAAGSDVPVVDVAATLAARTAFEHRAVVVGASRERLCAGLVSLAGGVPSDDVVTGTAGVGKVVLVFPGQGSQWDAMARDLYGSAAVFRDRLDECARAMSAHVEWDLREVLLTDEGARLLARVDVVQPALFAVMVSLAALWESYGLRPSAVVGHSQGEIAAACVAGALSLQDAVRVVTLRSQAIRALAGQGGMVSVALPADQVRARLDQWHGEVTVAAINGPRATVVSGGAKALDEVQAVFEADGFRTRRIPVDYASHSPHVEQIGEQLVELLASVSPRPSDIHFYSTVTAERIDTTALDAGYWFRNLRSPVEFEATTRLLLADGHDTFVECSPHPVLVTGVQETIDAEGVAATNFGTLRRDGGGLAGFLLAAAHAFTAGAVRAHQHGGRHVKLPGYPFQRERYWLKPGTGRSDVSGAGLTAADHPLLGAVIEGAASTVLTGRISLDTHPWLADHKVAGITVLPGAAFVELALHAADQAGCGTVRELTVRAPLLLPERGALRLRVEVGEPTGDGGEGARPIRVDARPDTGTGASWTCHATGILESGTPSADWDLTNWPPAGAQPLEVSYDGLAAHGYHYGPAFQGLRKMWQHNDHLYAEVSLPTDPDTYNLHPALLDATLHAALMGQVLPDDGRTLLPYTWAGVTMHASSASALRVSVTPVENNALRLRAADGAGLPVVEVTSLAMLPAEATDLGAQPANHDSLLRLEWVPAPSGPTAPPARISLVGPDTFGLRSATGTVDRQEFTDLSGVPDDAHDVVACIAGNDVREIPGATRTVLYGALDLVREWLADSRFADARLVVLTRHAVMTGDREPAPDLTAAPVWGLLRSAQTENPGRLVLVDVDDDARSLAALPSVLAGHLDQCALRGGHVLVPRLVRASSRTRLRIPEGVPWRLDVGDQGEPESLSLVPCEEAGVPLRPEWIRVAVRACGLDRREVRTGLPDANVGAGAGVVLEVGSEVTAVRPGDRVLGMLSGAFASTATADHRWVTRIPSNLTFEQAAVIPLDIGRAAEAAGAPEDPDRYQSMIAEAASRCASDAPRPSPIRAWDIREAPEAFRFLSQGGNTGRNVLTMPPSWDVDGTVLITGGSGTLGRLIATHLVAKHGVRNLVLVSRHGAASPGAADLVAELSGLGAEVSVAACDAADRIALSALIARIPADRPLTGVVHAAGILEDGLISGMTPEKLDAVLRPKLDAAWNLHDLTSDLGLSAFVLFSSIMGTIGNAGQGNYAAANTFLDALAQHRRATGLPATSLAWGFWGERSELTGDLDDADIARIARTGLKPLPSDEGVALFDAAFAAGEVTAIPAALDLDRLRLRAKETGLPEVFRGLVRARRAAGTATAVGSTFAGRLAGRPAEDVDRELLELVRSHTATVLGHAGAGSVQPDVAFRELGVDSLSGMELRNRLNDVTGLRLPSTVVFDHPTPSALVTLLRAQLLGETAHVATPAAPVSAGDDDLVAIVGMGCRYPGGVRSPGDLWDLTLSGRDVIGGLPRDRGWDLGNLFDADPRRTGKSYVNKGYFLDDVAGFDAGFFGISPREALAMDPQQRLLLETVWESLEDAGIEPGSLRGSDTGVFVGAMAGDYGPRLDAPHGGVDGYLLTGSSGSVLSGRVAYFLGLEGAAVTVDTACSSSLVALHQAVHAVRGGECGLALAGGVTVMSSPGILVEFSRQRGLSPDGRCKAFGASADGTGWGEGAGVVVLERLSVARARGHRVLAVVRGSAVNQDGASNGLTAPNGPSQQRVIGQALASAGLSGVEVDAVEGHGTGTRLGDPIEAQALLASYGCGRGRGWPLWLGSVKSNIGHTMAAAGVGGVIKMVEALRRGVLPATLHVDEPTPHVDWSGGGVRLLTEAREWPVTGRPRRAGVSSFGISGTNAHVILEQAPPAEEPQSPSVDDGPVGWALSARSEEALRAYARRIAAAAGSDVPVVDVAATLAARTAFEHRAVVVGASRERLCAGLVSLAGGVPSDDVVTGTAGVGKVVLVFPGQGSQWDAMARDLYGSAAVFRDRLDECARAMSAHVEWDLREVLLTDEGARLLARVDVVQPALFAVMVSLAALWESYGLRPSAVVGHSQGEIAAACVAGALSLQDAVRVVTLRSQAIRALAGQGGMVSVALPADQVRARLDQWHGEVTVAAINGPRATVVSGGAKALDEVQAVFEADGFRTRRIPVDYASHSPHVEQIGEQLVELLASVSPRPSDIHFYSTVTAERIDTTALDAGYWFRNLRSPVEFEATTRLLLADGHDTFVECSPHPVLVTGVQETIDAEGVAATNFGTLRRDGGGLAGFLLAAAHAFTAGAVRAHQHGGRHVKLPGYPFQRERYWLKPGTGRSDVSGAGLTAADHPLLGAVIEGAASTVLTGRISLDTHPWLADHKVAGITVLPGAAFVELALHAADQAGCGTVRELTVRAPLLLPERGALRLRVEVGEPTGDGGEGARPIRVDARPDTGTGASWTCHATGILESGTPSADWDLTNWPPAGAQPLEVSYDGLAAHGYHYGPAFQGLRKMWQHNDHLYAEVSLPTDPDTYNLHPALLDATLHAARGDGLGLATTWRGVAVHGIGATVLRVRISPNRAGSVSILLADDVGDPVAEVGGVGTTSITAGQLQAAKAAQLHALYREEWVDHIATKSLPRKADWAVVGADTLLAGAGLTAAGVPTRAYPELGALTEAGEAAPDYLVFTVAAGGEAAAATREAWHQLQDFLGTEALASATAVFLTTSAAPAFSAAAVDLAGAAVSGLLRSAQAENPGRFVLVDVDADHESWRALPRAVTIGEPHLALRGGKVRVPRLAPVKPASAPERCDDSPSTILVTGGSTAFGERLARHLGSGPGAHRVVLTGAEAPAPDATVTTAACDPENSAALRELIDGLSAEQPLSMIVHIPEAPPNDQAASPTPDALAEAVRARVTAATNLERVAGAATLVLCSSFAETVGGGSAVDAATAVALDAVARRRRAQGAPAVSLAWGPWAPGDEPTSTRIAGLGVLGTSEAVALFDVASRASEPVLIPARLDLAELARRARTGKPLPPVFRALVRTTGKRTVGRGAVSTTSLRQRFAAMVEADQDDLLSGLVCTHISAILGLDSTDVVQPNQIFSELGFDSLSMLTLRNRLKSATGLHLDPSSVSHQSTPSDLARHLKQSLLDN
ncbi:SDR family NAD(P)-dependent oxidoreductase [Streptomyces sp. JW3]|uniref:SDR family NAD(P)-dependent oxidoreductase n=1 Tax=Streptomyces sp. JW3 TaxID=3456955 RepID=UPI003FA470A7